MSNTKYLSELLTEEDIIQNPVTCMVAGLGSGKSTWVEGIHTTHVETKGLVDRYKALYITSRRSKVDESRQNNPALLKSIDSFFEHKEALGQAESVACTFSHVVEYIKRSRNTNPWFWRAFDYIVVDECHSLATDSTFTESAVIYDFLLEVYEDCIKDKEFSNFGTRIILMTATPNPIPTLLQKLNAHIIDLSTGTRWVKPNAIYILPFYEIYEEMQTQLKHDGRVVYYSTFFDKYKDLIALAESVGIAHSQIVVDVSSDKEQRDLRKEYPTIYENIELFRQSLSQKNSIGDHIKLVITNAKNKEGINIYSEIDMLVIENHYTVDIKQICGRFRRGIPLVQIVDDARQFNLCDKFSFEHDLAVSLIEPYNKHIQQLKDKITENDEKIITEIEQMLKFTNHISFNWFKWEFGINEAYEDCQKEYYADIEKYEARMSTDNSWENIDSEDPYFSDIVVYAYPRPDTNEMSMNTEFELCCAMCNYSVGNPLDYNDLNCFFTLLNKMYNRRERGHNFANVSCLLKKYGYRLRTVGKHTLKEDRTYSIEKVA